jgi:hypothetical protein
MYVLPEYSAQHISAISRIPFLSFPTHIHHQQCRQSQSTLNYANLDNKKLASLPCVFAAWGVEKIQPLAPAIELQHGYGSLV